MNGAWRLSTICNEDAIITSLMAFKPVPQIDIVNKEFAAGAGQMWIIRVSKEKWEELKYVADK